MDMAAKHIGFVLAAYGVAGVVITGLIIGEWLRARAVRRRLAELERLGAPRRARAAAPASEPGKEQTA